MRHGKGLREPIASLPGVSRLSPDEAVAEGQELLRLGVPAVILFGIPEKKDETGSEGWSDRAAVQETVRRLKKDVPSLLVMTDVCLDEYTSHGHCGVIVNGDVDNDATLPLLAKCAVSQARAGADVVAPSDMMDGRVAAIRTALDEAGFAQIPILSYAAKTASAFYGPFREAAGSAPKFGDRRGYQMDGANRREAMREIALDLEEGADAIMVKPALALPRLDPRGAGALRLPDRRLQRLGRVRHGQGGGRQRMDRRAADHARDPDGDRPGRSGLRSHLPREGRGALAEGELIHLLIDSLKD